MKKRKEPSLIILFGIVILILIGINSFTLFPKEKSSFVEKTAQLTTILQGKKRTQPTKLKTKPGLGNICSGAKECTSYCHNHRGHCETYCKGNNKNELCRVLFPLEGIPLCGNNKEWFTVPPIPFEYLGVAAPLGSLNPPGHTFPTDHIYLNIKSSDEVPNMPERLDVVSPGEVYITRISSSEHPSANSSFTDYDLEFYPCKEVYAKFGHVSFLSQKLQNHFNQAFGDCIHNREGGNYCNKNVNFKLAAGEEIGKTEFKGVGRGFDFWLADYRNDKLNYTNPLRWSERSFYITCPADYFTPSIRKTLYSFFKIDGIPRTIEPICGTIEQDVAGTAQGAWFVKGMGNTNSEDSSLALAYDNFNPLKGVFSVDTAMSKSGLLTGAYLFDSRNSGLINRDFKEVTADGNIYCYDSLHKKYEDTLPMIIIAQMTNAANLRIEKQSKNECGNGPWSFSSTYTEFER